MITIPIPPAPMSELSISLDGETFSFAFRWSSRTQSWTMDLGDGSGVLLAGGIGLVTGYPLLERFGQRDGWPAGALILLDSEAQDAEPGFTDLGTRHVLVYLTAAEVAAA